ncbi:MAG: rhodanese-like domain-containing protein [Methylococcales bacterium]
MHMQNITAQQLKVRLEQDDSSPILLDVRETVEHQICHIEGSLLMPMQLIPDALDNLDPEQEIVVICHHGMRSLQVAEYLQNNGFSKVMNLSGGIEQWILTVDLSLTAY